MTHLNFMAMALCLTLASSSGFAQTTNQIDEKRLPDSEISSSILGQTDEHSGLLSSTRSVSTMQLKSIMRIATPTNETANNPLTKLPAADLDLGLLTTNSSWSLKNKRNIYSSLWTFASLNYLYADLVGIMDKNKLLQYQTGVVEGLAITPEFLTVAAAFMQIPMANVFLPQLIKDEKTLRWVQIASGTVMTLVQAGTLFVGKPTPYYALFSAFEIAATTYITVDAIRWKPKKNQIAATTF